MVVTRFETVENDVKRSKIYLLLIGACSVLTVVCACLIVDVVLLHTKIYAAQSVGGGGNSCYESSSVQPTEIGSISTSEVMLEQQTMTKPKWETDFRLPNDTLPLHYELFLNPDLNNGSFNGEVTIQIQNLNTRTFFAVNTKNLDIFDTRLTRDDGSIAAIKDAFEYKPNEFWIVTTKDKFEPGLYYLNLKFKGDLTRKIIGFYQSIYADHVTKTKRAIATSKFQPTYARQAFPCFDEPSFKSRFTVKLVRPTSSYIALSNMNKENEVVEADPNFTTVIFNTSVPMVTYLACFIVCDFDHLPPQLVSNLNQSSSFEFTVYSTPAQVNKTDYALTTGAKITSYYIEYFQIDYPLPKLDMIAIPDFVSGAMEHWGLITFREVNLLYSPDISSTTNMQRVATVIAHELAHMWFGNLMTLKWWDDLWLNEGFASYMEYKGVDNAHSDWKMMDQFLVDDLHSVLKLDAALSSHPIVQTVSHPDEITELFDTISYQKGASVIRMLEDFLGETVFQEGIHNFLDHFKFANAVTQDLWDFLQNVTSADINVTHIMDTWTRQMGYPVVTVTRKGGDLILVQNRFLADPNANTTGSPSPFDYKWDIPITYITDKNSSSVDPDHRKWLTTSMESLSVSIPADLKWIKFNYHETGYYRVNYDAEGWSQLQAALFDASMPLSVSDRAHLLDDVFSLADAGLVEYSQALNLSQYLEKEQEYVPWAVVSSHFSALKSLLADSLAYPDLRTYAQKLVKNAYSAVSWTINDGDSHLQRRLRISVLGLACSMGYGPCLAEVGSLFNDWIQSSQPGSVSPGARPNPDIRQLVYYYGMASVGNEAAWDFMWQQYLNETDAQEKTKLLNGLAAIKEPWLLRRYIQLAKNENYVRSQDYFSVLQYIANNPIGTPIVWDFVRSEWDYLVERFTLNDRYLGRMVGSITSSFSSKFKLQEMEFFFAQNPDAGAGTTARKQALETVSNRIKWVERNEEKVRMWLAEHV